MEREASDALKSPIAYSPLFANHTFLTLLLTSALFAFWFAVHLGASWIGFKRPDRTFAKDSWLYRERRFERSGHIYERIGVRRWKNNLPEGDALVKDEFRKKHLPHGRLTVDYLDKFCIESRRAEWVHWLAALPGPLFFVGGHIGLGTAMTAYALIANAPCIIAQRYNRFRLQRVRSRLTRLP